MKKLLVQSIGGSPNDAFRKWMAVTEPLHREYCDRHDADYAYFAGEWESGLHPTWNRLPMMMDAFDRGYDKVVWLDADTLIVDQDTSIFDATDSDVPMLMTRVLSSHFEFPWASEVDGTIVPADHWDVYNDGVLIMNNTPDAVACLHFAWANRRSKFKPWHVPGIPELDWILDYVYAHPDAVQQLSLRFNWMPYPEAPPYEEAVVMAWHGMPHDVRWTGFKNAMAHFYDRSV